MEKNIREKVITNLYNQAHKYYSSNIILEEIIIERLLTDENSIKGANQKHIEIIKKRLGIYDEGKVVSLTELGDINDKLSYQRIGQVIKKIINRIYTEDVEIKAQKIRNNETLKKQFEEKEIEYLELDNKTTMILREQGIITIKDLLKLTEQELKSTLQYKKTNYEEIIKRLGLFGFKLKSDKPVDSIGEEISKEAYAYLRRKGILTYNQIEENLNIILNTHAIPEIIKAEILEINQKHKNESRINIELIKEKQQIEKRINELEDRKTELQNELEEVLHADIEIQFKRTQIKNILEKQRILDEIIQEYKEKIEKINSRTLGILKKKLPYTIINKI